MSRAWFAVLGSRRRRTSKSSLSDGTDLTEPSGRQERERTNWPFAIATIVPIAVLLLQLTAGEASAFVFASMAIPMHAWAVYSCLVLALALVRKRRVWAVANIGVLVLMVIVLGGYSLGSPGEGQAATVKVMTLNVQLFYNHSTQQVANAIKSADPDIVCLQELPTTGEEQKFGALLDRYGLVADRRLGILSKHPITQTLKWSLGPHGRYAAGAVIDVDGKSITVMSVHLQHLPSDDLAGVPAAARNLLVEIRNLESVVTSLKGSPLILAGDLNSVPHGRPNRMLRNHLTDSFAATSRGFGFTIPSGTPLRRIDYIYAGNGLTPTASYVPSFIVSDHRAVVAEVALAK